MRLGPLGLPRRRAPVGHLVVALIFFQCWIALQAYDQKVPS